MVGKYVRIFMRMRLFLSPAFVATAQPSACQLGEEGCELKRRPGVRPSVAPAFSRRPLSAAVAALAMLGCAELASGEDFDGRLNLRGLEIDSRHGLVEGSKLQIPYTDQPFRFNHPAWQGNLALLTGTRPAPGRVDLQGRVIDSQQDPENDSAGQSGFAPQQAAQSPETFGTRTLALLTDAEQTPVDRNRRIDLQGWVIDSRRGTVNDDPMQADLKDRPAQLESPNNQAGGADTLALLTVPKAEAELPERRQNLQGRVISSQRTPETSQQLQPAVTDQFSTHSDQQPSLMVAVTNPPETLSRAAHNSRLAASKADVGVVFDFQRSDYSGFIAPVEQQTPADLEPNLIPHDQDDDRSATLASLKSGTGEVPRQSPDREFEGEEPAQPAEQSLSELSAESLSVFDPTIATYVQYDDNVLLDSDNEQADTLAVVRPMIRYRYQERKSQLELDYALEAGKYTENTWANFTDHHFKGDWQLKLDKRKLLKVSGSYVKSNESRSFGSTDDDRASLVGHPTGYQDAQLGLGYAHGSRLDRSHIEVHGFTQRIRLEDGDYGRSLDDRDVNAVNVGYFWHLRRRMSVFAEARYKSVDYDELLRDSEQTRVVIGSEIFLRKRLSGVARIGYEKKKFDQLDNRYDYGDSVWDVSLNWRPGPNTTVKVETVKELAEVEEAGQSYIGVFAVRKHLGVNWSQNWSSRLSTSLDLRLRADDVQGDSREDEYSSIRFGATYELTPGFKLGLDGVREHRKFYLAPNADRSTITLKAEYQF